MSTTNFSSVTELAISTTAGDVVKYDSSRTKDSNQGVDATFNTKLWMRGYTFGEVISPKTALNCELEFYQSSATADFLISFDENDAAPISQSITTGGELLTLPFALTSNPIVYDLGTRKDSFSLIGRKQFRSMQPRIESAIGRLSVRTLKASAFLDTIDLHTVS